MKVTAVYYCNESGPYQMYVLDVCGVDDDRIDNSSERSRRKSFWNIFEFERERMEYPVPSSDVVFIYTEDFRGSNLLMQVFEREMLYEEG